MQMEDSSLGSVAQKKAYFEAQSKIIAARKADLEDKEKKKGTKTRDPLDSEDQTQRPSFTEFKAAEPDLNEDKANSRSCADSMESESKAIEPKDNANEMIQSKDPLLLAEDVRDEACFRPGTPELHNSEEAAVVKAEASPLGSEEVKESSQTLAGIKASNIREVKSEKPLKSEKVTSAKRAVSTTSSVKKTPTSSTPKPSVTATSKLSRPTLSKSISPIPKALSKKANSTSPLTSKKATSVESRRVAPVSLHMSLNFDGEKSVQAMDTTMRKSLIMEKMGDKDIVKRAFKAFRNNFDQFSSSSPTNPSPTSENTGKETDAKTSSLGTPLKKTEGGNKLVKKSSPLSGQAGVGKTSTSARGTYAVVADHRNNKTVSSPYGLRNHDKADGGNKVSKKLEEKVNGKALERTQLQSKEKKEVENKRLQISYNNKTKPISATKSSSQKV